MPKLRLIPFLDKEDGSQWYKVTYQYKRQRPMCEDGNACSFRFCKMSHPLNMKRHGLNLCRDNEDCSNYLCQNKHYNGFFRKGLRHTIRRFVRDEDGEGVSIR